MWILLIVSLLLCSIGFKKYVYFISIGYGWAIAGEGIAMHILFHGKQTIQTVILIAILLYYGIRLSSYLILREVKFERYRKKLKEIAKDGKTEALGAKLAIWISVSLLYVAMVSPVYFRLLNDETGANSTYIGIVIAVLGLMLESAADIQKTKFKKETPNMVVTKGLYRVVRCPNYLGEMIIWTGMFSSGVTCYNSLWQWIVAIIGYVCIIGIMFNGAYRLEKRQMKTYGALEAYQKYADTTPIMIPFVPLYHVVKQS